MTMDTIRKDDPDTSTPDVKSDNLRSDDSCQSTNIKFDNAVEASNYTYVVGLVIVFHTENG